MAYYSFHTKDNKAVSLNEVDNAVCAYWGIEPNDEFFSDKFNSLTTIGIISARSEKGTVTPETFQNWLDNRRGAWTEKDLEFFREFLLDRYVFRAWC
jgi:hypothetical protein